jgi:hypothetical protein
MNKKLLSLPGFTQSLLAIAVASALYSAPAQAQAVTPPVVGQPYQNPATGVDEIVEQIVNVDPLLVRTNKANVFWLNPPAIGATFQDPKNLAVTLTVTQLVLSPITGKVSQVIATPPDDDPNDGVPPVPRTINTVQAPANIPGIVPGQPPGNEPRTIPPGDNQIFTPVVARGSQGASGSDGFEIPFCLWECWYVGVSANPGDPGGAAAAQTFNETSNYHSVSDATHTIFVTSYGGNGGKGGNGYASAAGGQGGASGEGGNSTVTSSGTLVTSGQDSFGMFVQSRAGKGGDGGTNFGWDSGGNGGPAAQGGDAIATNTGTIRTFGDGSFGIFSQSLGGGGGNGGDSYGIVGSGGNGNTGGNGGDATATNLGNVHTGDRSGAPGHTGVAAHGVFAQSVGGTGGNGGDAGSVIQSLGGNGGEGGDGGNAVANNSRLNPTGDAFITTEGDYAFGLFAQSVGGGGGDGGDGGGIIGLGGNGATGGIGGEATATNYTRGFIHTFGEGSYGIFAQSVGGGGGSGGDSKGIVAIGGQGYSGGHGGAATVKNNGSVLTEGYLAHAVVAQSVGGGGGSGGSGAGLVSVGGDSNTDPDPDKPVNTDMRRNDGGLVTVINAAGSTIGTLGDSAFGILAQSIGGGGGTGGGADGVVGVGGKGGIGGDGGEVHVTNNAVIGTVGLSSQGIVAQSIGGGGGSATATSGVVALGGSGGGGGDGRLVVVDNFGQILTNGTGADGIVAQSIGGGGGNGANSGGVSAIGGSGAGGGGGGQVRVTNSGSIVTGRDLLGLGTSNGARARGIYAESIGGGGGNGGDGGGLAAIGGSSSAGSDSDLVTVNNNGSIVTYGAVSSGIEAASIGGGGGSGGASSGVFLTIGGNGAGGANAGEVHIDNLGSLTTFGNDSHGIFAQSVGGGGGNGGNATAISVFGGAAIGGAGGGGGNASLVRIGTSAQTGGVRTIDTSGDRSKGILAQSIGGGGGNGGFSAIASVGYVGAANASIGGAGGAGRDGGNVEIWNLWNIHTDGDDSDGIVAQSIGGGGGNGGFAVGFAGSVGDVVGAAFSAGVGGEGGGGGRGQTVQMRSGGDIRTDGAHSDGIVAQSIGGGGGNGGFAVTISAAAAGGVAGSASVSVGGAGGLGGDAGHVDVQFTGDITTRSDESFGAVLQAVGGRGGNGGFTVAGAVSGGGAGSASAAIGVGGDGGGAGDGGVVDALLTGDISTAGDRSTGLLAQSVGGSGGNGGFNISGVVTGSGGTSGGVAVGVGGAGGAGGNAKTVGAKLIGNAMTLGQDSDAVVVQSVGGGGGNGGMNVSGTIVGAAGAAGAVSVGVGGTGGDAGNAQAVIATVQGNIGTAGRGSNAFIAQSLGGGGGNGGLNVSASVTGSGGGGGSVAVGVGGAGGGGGTGSTVLATLTGNAVTLGDQATAVIAQSVGGGGGNGGMAIGAALTATGGGGGAVAVGVGGSGGGGGAAALTILNVTGDVDTVGTDSDGIVVQALGGGGGNGGIAIAGALNASGGGGGAVGVGVGGYGGDGGAGGEVRTTIIGDTHTRGAQSTGITAQSIGGGGGNGGISVVGVFNAAGAAGGAVAVGVGGGGANASNGEKVTATVTGDIETEGDESTGFFAQSLGGGGGSGGLNVSGAFSATGSNGGAVAVGVGGSAGGGGDARDVSATLTGNTITRGDNSAGVIAQSLGGGGGNGGMNVSSTFAAAVGGSTAGAVSVGIGGSGGGAGNGQLAYLRLTGDVTTGGENSAGVIAQSLGGGGGNGGMNVTAAITAAGGDGAAIAVGVGGSGGGGGSAGHVDSAVTGNVSTAGARSIGVIAQSLGGGGGNGGMNLSASLVVSGQSNASVAIGVGGGGGGAGDGARVDATVRNGLVHTSGDESHGVLMQSVGGGGGSGGMNVSGSVSASAANGGAIAVGVGGSGGGGGGGGTVNGDVLADVLTEGDDAYGVIMQSVGGGGGNGALNVSGAVGLTNGGAGAIAVGLGGSGATAGNALDVDATVNGQVETHGNRSIGVLAQSVGGGGGNGGMNVSGALTLSKETGGAVAIGAGGFAGGGGDADIVTLHRDGVTSTDGANAHGVIVQSLGGGGGNGGMNVSGALAFSSKGNAIAISAGLGGFGGDGGDAKAVSATLAGDVLATGFGAINYAADEDGVFHRTISDGSNGVLVQSLGGGGGNGGINISGGIGYDSSNQGTSHSLTLGVGGFGGGGGDAGAVTLDLNANTVRSIGDQRFGVGAQSVGGGGGTGGMNVSGGIAMDGVITAGIGGFGGDGGKAGLVDATANTDIFATGSNAIGFFAQSLGGSGGYGAINISGAIQGSSDTSKPTLNFGLGGFGGAGNISSTVDATQHGDIAVQGRNSIGVLAQSVAGGGGAGGLNVSGNLARGKGYNASIGIGGSGGAGANADRVTLISDGNVSVDGREAPESNTAQDPEHPEFVNMLERANGVLVQSIGGGGGEGGMNLVGLEASNGNTLTAGVGGTGGGGGDGGEVHVQRGLIEAGLIQTFGNQANGLVAQSVGGGGGNAGVNMMASTTKDDGRAINVGVGGSGGAPGHGKLVDVQQTGDIITQGSRSIGLLAQSIGGGGGNATYNLSDNESEATALNVAIGGDTGPGGNGGEVLVKHSGNISTAGSASVAIFAQSIGGGGGSAGTDFVASSDAKKGLSIQMGRKGGTGGDGNHVRVDADGILTTVGDRSAGILAQSVGSGGGESSSNSIEVAHEGKEKGSDKAASLEVGIDGAVGGVAGAVEVFAQGGIHTRGLESHGIHAQSVGGGGGSGGGIERQPAATASHQIMVGVGGSGGDGGIAGAVTVDSAADIQTEGDKAIGIFAQSVGGGGGTGGYTATVDLEANSEGPVSETLAVSVGGDGGTGSTSSTVGVTNRGTIITRGRDAHGIDAESTGGGGGFGGAVLSVGSSGDDTARSLSVNVGGSGGDGGTSEKVTVLNQGSIETFGDNSVGVRARSIGGKGGDGGLILNLGYVNEGPGQKATRLTVNVGGDGAIGGVSGDVEVTNKAQTGVADTGVIVTHGHESHGIFAQSIGGGGGNGSSIITSNLGTSSSAQVTVVDLAFGGKGGNGSKAGSVTVTNESVIDTAGDEAHGIFAQSIGGGGGNGGLALAANAVLAAGDPATEGMLTLGGAGGTGDDAGDVVVNNSGRIITRGERSNGILAQSIGGGGGNAGVGFGLSTNPGTMAIAGVMSAVFGGKGGDGGLGGHVTVNHSGDITVLGNGSRAVVAESINGGGGEVVLDFNGVATLPGLPSEVYNLIPLPSGIDPTSSLVFFGGGDHQGDSNAGKVTLNLTGTFGVAGNNGVANAVQAVGGGGGTYDLTLGLKDVAGTADDVSINGRLGGVSGTNNRGGDIESLHDGDLVTEGDNTPGALVQSVGGGGGRANLDVSSQFGSLGATSLTLGGEDGNNEEGGDIEHEQNGSSSTQGAAAHGGVFQSVGGGGGSVSLMVDGGTQAPTESIASRRMYKNQIAQQVAAVTPQINLGSNGGGLLKGGQLSVTLGGGVGTQGDHALGLVFQSVGAGGGVANVLGVDALGVTLGGAAGASGDGGNLEVTNTGVVLTQGDRAHGVFLQSLGGGGGAVFTSAAAPEVTLSTNNTGSGGNLSFTQNGSIGTQGAQAYGVFAQSVGGGGGFVDGAFAGSAGGAGSAGTITLELNGDIVALGGESTGLFAQSTAANGLGSDITATLATGKQLIGGEGGTAVYFDGGAVNRFNNGGIVRTLSGPTGMAFRGGAGGDFFDNNGTVMGNIDLGGGANGFANNVGAILYSGTTLNLGDPANVLTNNGLLSPGGPQLAVHTQLSGSYDQSATGVADLEIDFGALESDRLSASGTARVGGVVNFTLLNTQFIRSGLHYQPLFVAAGGVTNTGIDFNPQQSIVMHYALRQRGADNIGADYNVEFAAAGLRGNRLDVGNYLDRLTANGDPGGLGATVSRAVQETDLGNYATMLTQLGAEFYAEQQALALSGVQRFSRNLQNCGTVVIGETVGDENGCTWARYDDNPSSRESRDGFPSGSDDGFAISAGLQMPGDHGWTFGGAFDVEDHRGQGYEGLWSAEGKFFQMGASARRELTGGSFGATLSFGDSNQDVTRMLGVTDVVTAHGNQEVTFLSSVLDYTWSVSSGGFTFQPSLNLGASVLWREAMQERGAGSQGTVIFPGSEDNLWVEPALGVRYSASFAGGATLHTFARLGYLQYITGTSTEVLAGLSGAPDGVAPMHIGSDLDRNQVVGEAGMQWQAASGFTLGVSYSQQQSDLREGGAGSLRFVMPLK